MPMPAAALFVALIAVIPDAVLVIDNVSVAEERTKRPLESVINILAAAPGTLVAKIACVWSLRANVAADPSAFVLL